MTPEDKQLLSASVKREHEQAMTFLCLERINKKISDMYAISGTYRIINPKDRECARTECTKRISTNKV